MKKKQKAQEAAAPESQGMREANNANKLKSSRGEEVNLFQYFYIQYGKQNFW